MKRYRNTALSTDNNLMGTVNFDVDGEIEGEAADENLEISVSEDFEAEEAVEISVEEAIEEEAVAAVTEE